MTECSHEDARRWNYARWCPTCGAYEQVEGMGWKEPAVLDHVRDLITEMEAHGKPMLSEYIEKARAAFGIDEEDANDE